MPRGKSFRRSEAAKRRMAGRRTADVEPQQPANASVSQSGTGQRHAVRQWPKSLLTGRQHKLVLPCESPGKKVHLSDSDGMPIFAGQLWSAAYQYLHPPTPKPQPAPRMLPPRRRRLTQLHSWSVPSSPTLFGSAVQCWLRWMLLFHPIFLALILLLFHEAHSIQKWNIVGLLHARRSRRELCPW
ncbi:uncharacterized protein LOC119016128 isoform X2 [Acanthopagrus latus]|uniref:uncharacterized protein LOC119016128 isoform X2 n=1 Tax=Acanthopagrus latus TaxID=8177 RepID=UPI00187CC4C0|nr:uncharacterized protein LOC119016128 isoform X2 [Acanthopagrus latus]